ncbi:hypothetical protein FNJ61_07905, partial [Bacteroides pyogenes]
EEVNMSVFLFEKEYCLLEPCEGKLSRTVLRGESTRKGADLPDLFPTSNTTMSLAGFFDSSGLLTIVNSYVTK